MLSLAREKGVCGRCEASPVEKSARVRNKLVPVRANKPRGESLSHSLDERHFLVRPIVQWDHRLESSGHSNELQHEWALSGRQRTVVSERSPANDRQRTIARECRQRMPLLVLNRSGRVARERSARIVCTSGRMEKRFSQIDPCKGPKERGPMRPFGLNMQHIMRRSIRLVRFQGWSLIGNLQSVISNTQLAIVWIWSNLRSSLDAL